MFEDDPKWEEIINIVLYSILEERVDLEEYFMRKDMDDILGREDVQNQ